MAEQEIGVANGWEDLDDDAYSSTVAFFKGGAKCVVAIDGAERGDEVLIWQGVPKLVEEDDDAYEITVFEGYDRNEVPDGADYLIVTKKHDQEAPVHSRFGQDMADAKSKAREEVDKVSNGDYN